MNRVSLKYQQIVVSAKDLFWKYGIKRVTIEEVCSEAKVSKMTFYKYFSNKLELAKAILAELIDSTMNKFEIIVESNVPFTEKLEAIFMLKIEAVNNISQEFLRDIYLKPELGLKDFLEQSAANSEKYIIKFYKDAQSNGDIRKDVNVEFIMTYSKNISTFMENEKLMAQYEKPMDFILEAMNLMFYGIVTSDE